MGSARHPGADLDCGHGHAGPATISLTAVGSAFGVRRSLAYLAGIVAGTTVVLLAVARPRPIFGRRQVARLLAGTGAQIRRLGVHRRSVYVNGQPGAVFLDPDGRLLNVISLDITDGIVQTVRSIINPEKLRHLGEPADARALLRARPQVEERAPN